jgi:hypothetical protein
MSFDDKTVTPDGAALAAGLGRTKALWDALVSHVRTEYAPVDETWGFSEAWSLRLIPGSP